MLSGLHRVQRTALAIAGLLLLPPASALAGTVISFGAMTPLPATESLGGTAVTVSDGVDIGTNTIAFDQISNDLGSTADLNALHIRPNGNSIFSANNFLFAVPGVGNVSPGGVLEYDVGSDTYSILFQDAGVSNVNAFSILLGGNYLLSATPSGTLPGVGAFQDGDIIEWDPGTSMASIYLAEAAIFTSGANNAIHALHALSADEVVFSASTDGIGTIGSNTLAYGSDSADLFRINKNTTVASLFLDGENLWDSGNTRNTDAVFVPEPATGLLLALGIAGLAVNSRRR